MMNFESNASQFNDTIKQLISLMMNQKLMKERMSGYKELGEMEGQRRITEEGAKQEGRIALQGIKHGDAMQKAKMEFVQKIAQDPGINRLSSLIFMGRQEGRDMSAEGRDLEQSLINTAGAVTKSFAGEVDRNSVYDMLVGLSEGATMKMVGTAQDMKRMGKVDIPSMKTQEAVAQTSKGRLAFDVSKLNVENIEGQQDEWLKLIRERASHIKTEGIKKEGGLSLGSLKALLGGSSGRVPDPLSSENRGAAYEWLTEIEMNLIDGKFPSTAERRFLKTILNTYRIQGAEKKTVERGVTVSSGTPGEGLPTPETQGFTPAEYGEVKAAQLDEQKETEAKMIAEKLMAYDEQNGVQTPEWIRGNEWIYLEKAREMVKAYRAQKK